MRPHRTEEVIAIAVPVLIEAVAVVLFIGMAVLWCAIGAGVL